MQMLYPLFLTLVSLGLLFSGCKEDPTAFTPENAIKATQPELAEYAAEHHVPLKEFKGPYLLESKGLEFPTYVVCYKHPDHYFRYDHYGFQVYAGPLSDADKKTADLEKLEWLNCRI